MSGLHLGMYPLSKARLEKYTSWFMCCTCKYHILVLKQTQSNLDKLLDTLFKPAPA